MRDGSILDYVEAFTIILADEYDCSAVPCCAMCERDHMHFEVESAFILKSCI
jgi:hypothetical protein